MFIFGTLSIPIHSKCAQQVLFSTCIWYIANTVTELICYACSILKQPLVRCQYQYRANGLCRFYIYIRHIANTVTEQICAAGSVLHSHLVCCLCHYRANVFCTLFGTLHSTCCQYYYRANLFCRLSSVLTFGMLSIHFRANTLCTILTFGTLQIPLQRKCLLRFG